MSNIDTFLSNCEGLYGPPYNYTGGRSGESYEYCQQNGVDCSGMLDMSLRAMGLSGCGGTVAISYGLASWQPYRRDGEYPRGTILVNDNATDWDNIGSDQSHVGVIHNADAQTLIHSSTWYSTGVSWNQYHTEYHDWSGGAYGVGWEWFGYWPDLGADVDPHYFPGMFVHPDLLAIWMATIAKEEYGLPEMLPVMCSLVELSDAWAVNPSYCYCFDELDGYGTAVDYDSLGFFQQRPSQGWGTTDQLMDPEYALRAFCRAAYDSWPSGTPGDAGGLGEWIANVQRPREDLRYKYALTYERAVQLVENGRALIPYKYVTEGTASTPTPTAPRTETPYGWMGFTGDPEQWMAGVGVPEGAWIKPTEQSGKVWLEFIPPETTPAEDGYRYGWAGFMPDPEQRMRGVDVPEGAWINTREHGGKVWLVLVPPRQGPAY